MHYKKFLRSLYTWGVFRRVVGGEPVCIASGITELDADRILAELGVRREYVTVEPPQLDTRMVIQIIGMPSFDWDKVRAAFDQCKDVRLICVGTHLLAKELPF
jgi:hypothetical protein